MALVLPANGAATALDVTDNMIAALDDGCGTRMVVESLGGTRENGLDHREFGIFSITYSGRHLLALTITSPAEELGLGENMHALALPRSKPLKFKSFTVN